MMNQIGRIGMGLVMGAALLASPARAEEAADSAFNHKNSIFVQCESKDNKYTHCPVNAGPIDDIYIDHQLSWVPCEEGKTWGWNNNGIWVTFGCRAVFEVRLKWGGPVNPPPPQGNYQDIKCESKSDKYRECKTYLYNIYDVRVIQQHSGAPCYQGSSFGWGYDRIWVDRGCRATFRVWGY